MVEDSPCTGVCRLKDNVCIACHRTYKDISEWFDMTKQQRLNRMEQIKNELSRKYKQKKESRN